MSDMPTCQHCKKQWSWKETMKNSFKINSGMICPHCKGTQYITTRSRKRTSTLNIFPPLTFFLPMMFGVPPMVSFIFFLSMAGIVIGTFPLLLELTNKEEPLW